MGTGVGKGREGTRQVVQGPVAPERTCTQGGGAWSAVGRGGTGPDSGSQAEQI